MRRSYICKFTIKEFLVLYEIKERRAKEATMYIHSVRIALCRVEDETKQAWFAD